MCGFMQIQDRGVVSCLIDAFNCCPGIKQPVSAGLESFSPNKIQMVVHVLFIQRCNLLKKILNLIMVALKSSLKY